MVTLLRSITEDEESLERIKDIQDQFFKSMKKDEKLPDLKFELKEMRAEAALNNVSPHYKGITSDIDDLASFKKAKLLKEKPKLLMNE